MLVIARRWLTARLELIIDGIEWMSTSRLCANCQHANPITLTTCERCGAALPLSNTETLRFSDLPEVAAAQRKPAYQAKTFPGHLAVYVMDDINPLVFEDNGTLILGRSALGEPSPTINLTRHHAGLLGVSRRHAAIHVVDGDHTITDLNSSNGTWVNHETLAPGQPHPLRSGDLVRLGHLVLHVYFEETASSSNGKSAETSTLTRPPTSDLGSVSTATIRLVGRPGAVEYRNGQVILRLLHLPVRPDAGDEATALPVTPTRFTIHLTSEQWLSVRDGLQPPDAALVVEGNCTYGSESAGIVIQAAQVAVQPPATAAVEPTTQSNPHPAAQRANESTMANSNLTV